MGSSELQITYYSLLLYTRDMRQKMELKVSCVRLYFWNSYLRKCKENVTPWKRRMNVKRKMKVKSKRKNFLSFYLSQTLFLFLFYRLGRYINHLQRNKLQRQYKKKIGFLKDLLVLFFKYVVSDVTYTQTLNK